MSICRLRRFTESCLATALAALGLCALCAPARAAPGEGTAAAAELTPANLLSAVNDYRARRGLGRLHADARLEAIALEHSASMANAGRLSHGDFQARFRMTGRALCVENLAVGGRNPGVVIGAWRQSPEHHTNLLETEVDLAGVAMVGRYITWLACTHRPA